jgi:hypothetical protein
VKLEVTPIWVLQVAGLGVYEQVSFLPKCHGSSSRVNEQLVPKAAYRFDKKLAHRSGLTHASNLGHHGILAVVGFTEGDAVHFHSRYRD